MRSFIAIITIALSVSSVYTNWADKKPFCKFPGVFPVSRKPTDTKFDISKTGDRTGLWYAVAYKEFGHGSRCKCMATTYGISYTGAKVGTGFHCAAEKPYVNVKLTS